MAPLLYTNAAGGTLLEPIMNMSNLPTPDSKCFFEFLTKSIESNFRIEIEPHLIPQSARCTDIVTRLLNVRDIEHQVLSEAFDTLQSLSKADTDLQKPL